MIVGNITAKLNIDSVICVVDEAIARQQQLLFRRLPTNTVTHIGRNTLTSSGYTE